MSRFTNVPEVGASRIPPLWRDWVKNEWVTIGKKWIVVTCVYSPWVMTRTIYLPLS